VNAGSNTNVERTRRAIAAARSFAQNFIHAVLIPTAAGK